MSRYAFFFFLGLVLFLVLLKFTTVACPAAEKADAQNVEFMVAGVPKVLAESKNYDAIFSQLKRAGVGVFLPFSEYQEIPAPKSLDTEKEFFPQWKTNDLAIDALRKNGIKLLIPAAVLYPAGKLPPIAEDPLRKVVDWAGRRNVFGVYTYDEPVLNNSFAACEAVFKRVKQIDQTIPVVMVHAPIPESASTKDEFQKYFDSVKAVSKFSDIVGFDVYAIPKDLMKVHGPYSGSEVILDYKQALSEYQNWLKRNLPAKRHFLVMQAFCQEDQGHPHALAKLYGDRRPTPAELQEMVSIASNANTSVAWWGQSLVKDRNLDFWQQILDATRKFSRRTDIRRSTLH